MSKKKCKFCNHDVYFLNFYVFKAFCYCSNCNLYSSRKTKLPYGDQYSYFNNLFEKEHKKIKIWDKYKVNFCKDIFLKNKKKKFKILEISGGPGIDSFNISKSDSITAYDVTEVNENFVKFYNDLSLKKSKCYYLDFNKKLTISTNKKYDIILICNSINYFKNFKKLHSFVKFLYKICNKNGKIYLKNNNPNIGTACRVSMWRDTVYYLFNKKKILTFFLTKFKLIYSTNTKKYSIISKYYLDFGSFKSASYSIIGIINIFLKYLCFRKLFNFKDFFYGSDYCLTFQKNKKSFKTI